MPRILVVEGNPELCLSVSDYLYSRGFAVDMAMNGNSAVGKLKSAQYDLLIMDWDLPGINGLELCKQFRSDGGTAPVLMLIARSTPLRHKQGGFQSGADDYLTKPFEQRELLERVTSMLRRAADKTEGPAQDSMVIGTVLDGKYRLDELIGGGGMAVVYKATHVAIDKPVVVKLVLEHLLKHSETLKRFEQECRVMARINHPNVVSVFDVGCTTHGRPYLVMEYIDGLSLREELDKRGVFSLEETLEILIEVCRGLQEAHDAGVIHRDLKPENILLQHVRSRMDWVKICDFGIARLLSSPQKLTEDGSVIGTFEYIAPEQLKEYPVDTRVDIYALGVIMFELLTGRCPITGAAPEALFLKKLTQTPDPLSRHRRDLPMKEKVDEIVAKALAIKPHQRWESAVQLGCELEQLFLVLSKQR
jgi:serine/threonine protein kinase